MPWFLSPFLLLPPPLSPFTHPGAAPLKSQKWPGLNQALVAHLAPGTMSAGKLLEKPAHLALGEPMLLWPLLGRTKRAGAQGAPTRKGGERHRGAAGSGEHLEPGGRAGAGRQGWSRPPRPARVARWPARPFPALQPLHFDSLFLYVIMLIIFPRKACSRDWLAERQRGRHFPGKAQRASEPGAPEREPEGSARPRALLPPARRGAHGTRGAAQQPRSSPARRPRPDLPWRGTARLRPAVLSLRSAPPRPSIVAQPGHLRGPEGP
jgi:hypothetical protein